MTGEVFFITALLTGLILFSSIPLAESVLWDLLISVNFEKNPLEVFEKPIVVGAVVDHAGKPVSDAELKIRLDNESVITSTNTEGSFRYEFEEWQGNPGVYIVNVMATSSDDRIGLARTDLQIKGAISLSESAYNLDLIDYTQFEGLSIEELENDPIALTLYNYYHELQKKVAEEEKKQTALEEYQTYLEQQRAIAYELQQKIIEEKNPGSGVYSGFKYDQFVSNLDSSVRDIIVNQLNYTIIVFSEAQLAMEEVLENGGTLEQARQAYYEKASIPRELMDTFTTITDSDESNITVETIVNDSSFEVYTGMNYESLPLSDENSIESLNVNVNASTIQLGENVTTIFLNINGTIIEIIVNGTEISQASSSQN